MESPVRRNRGILTGAAGSIRAVPLRHAHSPPVLALSIVRQSRSYLMIGGLQWVLDWAVMVALSHAGLPVRQANVVGRICGALCGFWMNGRFTFACEDTAVGRVQLQRFLVMWVATTVVSTWAIGHIDDYLGRKWAWLAKPLVEIALGVGGFVISRSWIYKR